MGDRDDEIEAEVVKEEEMENEEKLSEVADGSKDEEDVVKGLRAELAKSQTEANDRFFLNLGYEKDCKVLLELLDKLFTYSERCVEGLDIEDAEKRAEVKELNDTEIAKLKEQYAHVRRRLKSRLAKTEDLDDLSLEHLTDGMGGMMQAFGDMMNPGNAGEGEGAEAGCTIA